jgi:hypothetical protein
LTGVTKSNCVVHIGAGKCGSSSLQHALSYAPDLRGSTCGYSYCAFGPKGRFLSGPALTAAAQATDFGYVTCPTLPPDEHLPAFRSAGGHLRSLTRRGQVPILSNEGWIYASEQFDQHDVLDMLEVRPRVIAFIRPPLEWLNSAWWQWGAWSGAPFERWISNAVNRADWARYLTEWKALDRVVTVEARILGPDVVSAFYSALGIRSAPPQTRRNTALPASVLRFFQRNRAFRPGPHDSRIDFLIARHLGTSDAEAPWVIPPAIAERIMERLRPGISDIRAFLDQEDADRLDSDVRWHDPTAYSDRELEPADDPGDVDLADALIADLLDKALPGRKR